MSKSLAAVSKQMCLRDEFRIINIVLVSQNIIAECEMDPIESAYGAKKKYLVMFVDFFPINVK